MNNYSLYRYFYFYALRRLDGYMNKVHTAIDRYVINQDANYKSRLSCIDREETSTIRACRPYPHVTHTVVVVDRKVSFTNSS